MKYLNFIYFNPLRIFLKLWGHRDLIRQLTWREISAKYKASYLGLLWSFINPVTMVLVYAFVFGTVFKAKWNVQVSESKAEFALALFVGIFVYNIFSESINRAPGLIVSNPNYIKKVIFPVEILPVVVLGSVLLHAAISFVVLVVGMILFMGTFNVTILFFPLILIPLIMMSLGFSWLLSSLGVFIRDIGYTIAIFTQILFFLTPVFYPISSVPEEFQPFMKINPLTPIVENARNVIMWGKLPDFNELFMISIISYFIMIAGFSWFMRTKKAFADVI